MNTVVARIGLSIVIWASGLGQTNQKRPAADNGNGSAASPSMTDVYEAVLRYQIRSWELLQKQSRMRVWVQFDFQL
jgi:hypothetical protein